MSIDSLEVLITTTLRMLPPILLAGLGGMISSRVKITNMGLEGMMLTGAFVAVVVMYFGGNSWMALAASALAGGVLGVGFALIKIKYNADNVVVSVAINMFALGFTSYLMSVLFHVNGAVSLPGMQGLEMISIPVIRDIPLLRSFSGHSILVYLSLILVGVFQFIMYHTVFGLRLRASGPHPMAVVTAGANVNVYKVAALFISGMLGGLGGAHLSVGQLAMFSDNMTNGRGFIALAATTFGNYTPLGTLFGSVLFSFADASTMKIQTTGFPSPLVQMLPYIVTLLMLWGMAVRTGHRKRETKKGMI